MEYTFQVELNIKNNKSDIDLFQEFTARVLKCDNNLKFLPWSSDNSTGLPNIDVHNSPYSLIRGAVRLRHYLGPYNRDRNCLYGRVKVRTRKNNWTKQAAYGRMAPKKRPLD